MIWRPSGISGWVISRACREPYGTQLWSGLRLSTFGTSTVKAADSRARTRPWTDPL